MATWTAAISSLASAPNAVKPRIWSLFAAMSILSKPPRLGQRPGPRDRGHRQGEQAVSDAAAAGLGFVAADPGQLRIQEHAGRHQAAGGAAGASAQFSRTTPKSSKGTGGNYGAGAAEP